MLETEREIEVDGDEDRAQELADEAIDDEGWVKTYHLIPDWLCEDG